MLHVHVVLCCDIGCWGYLEFLKDFRLISGSCHDFRFHQIMNGWAWGTTTIKTHLLTYKESFHTCSHTLTCSLWTHRWISITFSTSHKLSSSQSSVLFWESIIIVNGWRHKHRFIGMTRSKIWRKIPKMHSKNAKVLHEVECTFNYFHHNTSPFHSRSHCYMHLHYCL